jgi:hypothetical protein
MKNVCLSIGRISQWRFQTRERYQTTCALLGGLYQVSDTSLRLPIPLPTTFRIPMLLHRDGVGYHSGNFEGAYQASDTTLRLPKPVCYHWWVCGREGATGAYQQGLWEKPIPTGAHRKVLSRPLPIGKAYPDCCPWESPISTESYSNKLSHTFTIEKAYPDRLL